MNKAGNLAIGRDNEGRIEKIRVVIPIAFRVKDGLFSVCAPSLDTFGYSKDSIEDAIDDLKNSLSVFFDVHVERGTLEKALEFFGWEEMGEEYLGGQDKHLDTPKTIEMEVPLMAA